MKIKDNNFDILRLFAAFQVFYFHAIAHLQINIDNKLILFFKNFPGVIIFFTLSGFLISSSYERNKNINKYFYNRALRIFPGLWFCLIITIILLLLFNIIDFSVIFSFTFIKWFIAQVSFFQFWTPDILRTWGVGTPNGSLWTIIVEIQFYLILPLIFKWLDNGMIFTKIISLVILSICSNIFIQSYLSNQNIILYKLSTMLVLPYLYNFMVGVLLFKFWNKISLYFINKLFFWIILYLIFLYSWKQIPSYYPTYFGFLINITLSFLVISFAFSFKELNKILKGQDFSYGIYIYHMLIINSFVSLGYTTNIYNLLFSIILVFIFAFFSWNYIEKKILTFKN